MCILQEFEHESRFGRIEILCNTVSANSHKSVSNYLFPEDRAREAFQPDGLVS